MQKSGSNQPSLATAPILGQAPAKLADREVLFYYRNGCHLCEEMAAVLQQQWPDAFAQLQWCDVDSDPVWQDKFGELIPALVVDQQLICNYVVEPDRISACFGVGPNPV